MAKSKKPEQDIYKALRQNHLIVWLVVICAFSSVVIIKFKSDKTVKEALQKTLVLDSKGEVIPLSWIDRNENIHIEIQNHLDHFLRYFYEYDGMSYKRRIEEHALWLGDKSVEDLYIKRTNDNWYDKVKQFQITQTLFFNPEDIQVAGNKEPYRFRVDATLVIKQGLDKKAYQFTATGNIALVDRNYPLNPHGLLITNFIEKSKEEIKED